ncbi:MAG: glycerol acyltransferase [SAR86 cluster bacterium]|uniref:Glycerol acyltransferase n=1 Tax=SAR86 cluster bacterium TaxID=2030880 RepID=A0A2A5CJC7_9GAMM|nr:lysophospholipid acyltransferase family protein [Gammaproteobacteria bacterium AH-315-E17]PCJ43476.1 MAG: glycerol acyltransferase [SAR86 cluster bacterium]
MKSSVFNTPVINSIFRGLAKLGLSLSGWKVIPPPDIKPPFVVIGAPHTSNWDFLLMLAAVFLTRMDVKWMGKNSLFLPIFGGILRWFGGIPIDRSQSHSVVQQMVTEFQSSPSLSLIIAPEGTRKKVSQWKSGFYHIAHQAGVPIMLGVIDAEAKEVRFAGFFKASGNYEEDLPLILEHYHGTKGIIPKNSL